MKKNKGKLLSAVAMLLVSAIAVTSASYAWFTMNNSVSANGLSLTAASPAMVEISLDGTTWGTTPVTLPATTLSMRPTSTTTALNSSFFEVNSNVAKITAGAAGAFKAISALSTSSQYYYDTTLHFRTKGAYAINLTLGTLTVGGTDLNKAVRVAFLSTAGTAYSKGSDPLIYASTNTAYDGAATTDTIASVTPKIAGASNVVVTVPVHATDANQYGADTPIKVRIYLEGQDNNCVVANVLNSLSVALTFNGTEVQA